MEDRELLELAAKAAGLRINFHPAASYAWNPLTDDGDALRLAAQLGLMVDTWHERAISSTAHGLGDRSWVYASDDKPYSGLEATRRAIVRAAASIAQSATSGVSA